MNVQLHANTFEGIIARRGRDVKWQQAILCSCWDTTSGQPLYKCKACGGKGYLYEDPIIERAVVMSVTANKQFEDTAGVFDVGDAIMEVSKRVFSVVVVGGAGVLKYERESLMYDVGMYDLITLLDDDYKTSELLVRATDIYGRPADTLLNSDVVSVITIRMSNPDTGEVRKFEPGVDFTNDGNRIEWLGVREDEPVEGEQYSVTYMHRPVFTVLTSLPKPRHQDGQDLPRAVALRYRAGGFDPK